MQASTAWASDSPRAVAQRKALEALQAAPPLAARPVLQAFWEYTAEGKVQWKDGGVPNGYVQTGDKRKQQDVWAAPEVMAARQKAESEKAAEALKGLQDEAADRALPVRRRRDFTPEEKKRLTAIPETLVREDRSLKSPEYSGRRKAHLVEQGLKTAGKAPITATEQQDQDSVRKGRGNRISSKAPAKGQDNSQSYGNQKVEIKARKLERAKLRGKPDAQHVQVHTTADILKELDSGPDKSGTGKTRENLKAYARKDREFHHSVGFFSPENPEHFIPNRFLRRADMDEIHDSDSEDESDVEEDVAPEEAETVPEVGPVSAIPPQKQEVPFPLEVAPSLPAAVGSSRKRKKKKKKPGPKVKD